MDFHESVEDSHLSLHANYNLGPFFSVSVYSLDWSFVHNNVSKIILLGCQHYHDYYRAFTYIVFS